MNKYIKSLEESNKQLKQIIEKQDELLEIYRSVANADLPLVEMKKNLLETWMKEHRNID